MADRSDPHAGFNFLVEIDGVSTASFSEVAGLEMEISVVEYRTGAEDTTVRKLPGLRKYTNITLKRGIVRDRSLWDWIRAAGTGAVERRSGSIVLLDRAREQVLRWNFREGWPCKWSGPALSAKGNDVALETLEIAHEGLELDV